MNAPTLMLATNNAGKVAELRSLLANVSGLEGLTLLTPRDWPSPLPVAEETGETFEENARLKALSLTRATGLPALADDSGLCVDALGGAPGVHSARWAGAGADDAARNEKLLAALADVPTAARTARFVCAVAFALPEGAVQTAEGCCEGEILKAPKGGSGFGYDPLFLLPDLGRTFAETTAAEKNARSHRARAVAAIAPVLHGWACLFEARDVSGIP